MAGNSNSGRRAEKPFADALRMELAAAGADHKALRLIARQLIAKATDGDMQAIKELADRTDGKVPQALIGDSDADPINLKHELDAERFTRSIAGLATRSGEGEGA
jgi:hypothetical protein